MPKDRAKRARPDWNSLAQPKQGSGLKHNYIEVPKKKKVERPYPWDKMDVLKPRIK